MALDPSHPFFPKFKALMTEAAAHPPVYDIGTSGRFAKEVGLVRDLFDEQSYYACGYRPDNLGQPDGCDIDCDIQDMRDIADNSVGSVLCLEVLEHVERPHDAAREMHRILRPGGVVIVAVPFLFPYHGKSSGAGDARHEHYGDFWRFTHEGLALMFRVAGFSAVEVFAVDGRLISRLHSFGVYHKLAKLPGFVRLAAALDRPGLGRATTLHFLRASKT